MNGHESRWALLAKLAIEAEVGEKPDSRALAQATSELCQKLCDRLSLLLGFQGFRAVLAHALSVSRENFTFLMRAQAGGEREVLVGLLPGLQDQDPATATNAAVELLAQTLELLAGLIGAGLLHRYLLAAWPQIEGASGGPNPATADNGE